VGFSWKRRLVSFDFDVVDIAQAESGEMWAVAQHQRGGRTTSAILRSGIEEWVSVVALDSPLEAISVHCDRSIVAVGESSVHLEGDSWVVRELDLPCSQVLGAHAACVSISSVRHSRSRLVVKVLKGRRILLGQGSEVWESDPLLLLD
jgi:hypothetical protein